jgi:hypothetical protein
MKKLTNLQMTILSERVTDILQEKFEESKKLLEQSSEYVDFENGFTDSYVETLRKLDAEYKATKEAERLAKEAKGAILENVRHLRSDICQIKDPNWKTVLPEDELERYLDIKKEAKFGTVVFDREKILRKVQADILLSDVDNPEDLVNTLVEKLK